MSRYTTSSVSGTVSLGYQGLTLEQFIRVVIEEGIDVVVDVRLTPISRKRGFSKNALRATLADNGIDYLHEVALGNPRHNRAGYSEFGTDEGMAARKTFTAGLEFTEARRALVRVAALTSRLTIGVMCFESTHELCHRREVMLALEALPEVSQHRDSVAARPL